MGFAFVVDVYAVDAPFFTQRSPCGTRHGASIRRFAKARIPHGQFQTECSGSEVIVDLRFGPGAGGGGGYAMDNTAC